MSEWGAITSPMPMVMPWCEIQRDANLAKRYMTDAAICGELSRINA
jgi:hypothetical protein